MSPEPSKIISLANKVYIPKTPPLNNVIHSIWQVDRFNSFQDEQIIPNGVVELIFNFSPAPIPAFMCNRLFDLPVCFINGFNTLPIHLRLPVQQVFFGVRMQPLAVKKILKTPASAFSDIVVDLSLIGPNFQSLWHQLAELESFDARIAAFCGWIEKKCFEWEPRENLINDFLCSSHRPDLSVNELANSLCYSPRQLSRKMIEASGMNTEEILLYKKYLHAVHLMHNTDLLLTQIAYQAHFSDQSHFIKSFRAFTQLTPSEYHKNKGELKGHILGNVR